MQLTNQSFCLGFPGFLPYWLTNYISLNITDTKLADARLWIIKHTHKNFLDTLDLKQKYKDK